MELFIEIPNYEGLYAVSNLGRVKSLERFAQQRDGRNRLLKEKIVKPNKRRGYYRVTLRKDNIRKHYDVHQLVAMAFLNHKPNGYKSVVDHINHNTLDNTLGNLRITTQRENSNKKHLKSSSKYVGVCFDKTRKKWIAQIQIKGKKKFLGYHLNEYDAHLAYQQALKSITN